MVASAILDKFTGQSSLKLKFGRILFEYNKKNTLEFIDLPVKMLHTSDC